MGGGGEGVGRGGGSVSVPAAVSAPPPLRNTWGGMEFGAGHDEFLVLSNGIDLLACR